MGSFPSRSFRACFVCAKTQSKKNKSHGSIFSLSVLWFFLRLSHRDIVFRLPIFNNLFKRDIRNERIPLLQQHKICEGARKGARFHLQMDVWQEIQKIKNLKSWQADEYPFSPNFLSAQKNTSSISFFTSHGGVGLKGFFNLSLFPQSLLYCLLSYTCLVQFVFLENLSIRSVDEIFRLLLFLEYCNDQKIRPRMSAYPRNFFFISPFGMFWFNPPKNRSTSLSLIFDPSIRVERTRACNNHQNVLIAPKYAGLKASEPLHLPLSSSISAILKRTLLENFILLSNLFSIIYFSDMKPL